MISTTSILFTLLLSVTCAFAQDEAEPSNDQQEDPMVQKLTPLEGKPFEMQFLKMMIAHHEFGIKMGELVDERASNPELKKFAAKTVKKQREEVEKMTGWLEAWHDSAPDKEPVPEESQKKSKEQIERLGSLKGDKFDYAFLDIMTKHHQSGIDMFELVDDKTDREELEHFSKEGIAHQQKEIREMQAMHAYPEED